MTIPTSDQLLASITPAARDEPDSGIVKAAMYGFARPGIIPLWSGEGNLPTPELFARAASDSLLKGETFYTWQRGIPELRAALARYHSRHYGQNFNPENFYVTGGGMQAIQTALQMISSAGDEIIIPCPAWPNYAGPMRLLGLRPVEVPMRSGNGRWNLDLDRMAAAITPRSKAILINSPSNPLGWTATPDDLIAVRDLCRRHGLWMLADEVYSRFYYDGPPGARAPSFLDICDTEERLLLVNTFSKNWAMTGWRVGWLQAPQALGPAIERLIQYNTSGTAAFLQRGCVAALDLGEDFIRDQVARARANRDYAAEVLSNLAGISFAMPSGAFYLFFKIEGMTDSTRTCLDIIDQANVGFAPGATFGPGAEGHLRMCYLRDRAKLEQALARFAQWMRDYRLI